MKWQLELARQIKNARESAGLTQEQLAGRLDICRQMISRYEAGKDAPAIEVLAAMARTLDTVFRIQGVQIIVEGTSRSLRSMPKQLRLDFEKSQRFKGAVISITPSEGQILITAKIPA